MVAGLLYCLKIKTLKKFYYKFNEEIVIAYISDGQIVELTADDLVTGECLVADGSYFRSGFSVNIHYIYYLEDR